MPDSNPIIITIDGYSSTGKSTLARQLAAEIGYRYIDSGAMYRAVTLYALRHELIDEDGNINVKGMIDCLPEIHIDFRVDNSNQRTYLNGEDVEQEIRSMTVSDNVSPIAAIPEVRHFLTDQQRLFGIQKGIVMDGRDIGTTVFPDAELKLFVTATTDTRARRRFKELTEKGQHVTLEQVKNNLLQRDQTDVNRTESPLRKAHDAIMIDNTLLTPVQQLHHVLNLYHQIIESREK